MEKATFGAGCFWCTEAALKLLPGVITVEPGYAGGITENPTQEQVHSGKTGHVEAVQVTYDSTKTSFKDLLQIFWETHDPLQEGGQGADIGPQYQAIIFFHNSEQEKLAKESKQEVEQKVGMPVATQVKPFTTFYPAEDYHKNYFAKNPNSSYSQIVIQPKIAKVKTLLTRKT
jgi:peptide-methionine (S)-S-oxide reductase